MVTQVIVVGNDDTSDSNGVETESIGVAFCQKLLGADTNWKQTSYNNNMRGNYAGIDIPTWKMLLLWVLGLIGCIHSSATTCFLTISTSAAQWEAPITQPTLTDDQIAARSYYTWDESAYQADNTTGWVLNTPE